MKEKKYDLIIAWAWPAWITTAIIFKKYNPTSKILVFDVVKFPRFKIWEVILPWACEILKKLNLLESIKKYNFPRKMWTFYYWWESKKEGFLLPSNNLTKNNWVYKNISPNIYSYHVERKKYDYELIKQAKNRWIEVITWIKDFINCVKESNNKFLNYTLFDFNLQLYDKVSLRNGVEIRLPFTDYELIKFSWYNFHLYKKEVTKFLGEKWIYIIKDKYWFATWMKFSYFYNKGLIVRSKKLLNDFYSIYKKNLKLCLNL